jgi:hypothetical protein
MIAKLIPEPLRDIASGLYAYATFNPKDGNSVNQAQEAVQQALLSAQRTVLAAAAFFVSFKIQYASKIPVNQTPGRISAIIAGSLVVNILTPLLSYPSTVIYGAGTSFYTSWLFAKDMHAPDLQTLKGRLETLGALGFLGAGLAVITNVSYFSNVETHSPQWLENPLKKLSKQGATFLCKQRG